MEPEASRTLRYILSAFDLLTDIEKRELIAELQTRAEWIRQNLLTLTD